MYHLTELHMQTSATRGKRRSSALLFLSLCIALMGSVNLFSQASLQKADIPVLSLTGRDNNYNSNLYSDGRIWLGYADDRVREVLIPVFMKNLWYDSANVVDKRFSGGPIYSFTFSVMYDGRVFEAVGAQFTGPKRSDTNALAKGFELEFDDVSDETRYGVYFRGSLSAETKYGRRMYITGRSTKPLPVTAPDGSYEVLMYLRMKVTLSQSQLTNQPTIYNGADKSALYISNDSLTYNDLRVGVTNPFPLVSESAADNPYRDKTYRKDKRDSIGLGGISMTTDLLPEYPSRPGMVWINIGAVPQISFRDFQGNGQDQVRQDVNAADGSLWEMTKPIIIDSSTNGTDAFRDIILWNSTARSRLTGINLRSDSPWLSFQAVAPGFIPAGIRSITRDGDIDFIDNGINGPVPPNLKDARNQIMPAQDPIRFRIYVRTGELRGGDAEYAGIYTGYITVTSASAKVSPVKLRVTFIHLRNPVEPGSYNKPKTPEFGLDPGIKLTVSNSSTANGGNGDSTNLVFGTGHRATDAPDSLFGEYAYDVLNAPTGFYARWYTPWVKDANGIEVAPNGLGDIQMDAFSGQNYRRDSRSRDIRDFTSDTTLVYLCRFNANGANNYPIVINWDIRDFPEGADLYLRDTLNGGIFSVNMREATPDGDYGRSFTIRDARIKSFLIEYRLPQSASYPVVKKGWNFLSLPLRPSNPNWKAVFPNSITEPYTFASGSYQQKQVLQPGVGYFVKFGDNLDQTQIGSRVPEFSKTTERVYLFNGWNTVGSPSTRANVNDISYELSTGAVEALKDQVYGYTTDRGYYATSEVVPGMGYWIKVYGEGFYRVKGSGLPKVVANPTGDLNLASITVSDIDGRSNTLRVSENGTVNPSRFELPPVIAPDMFDVRFSNNAYATNSNDMTIRVQGVTFPMTLTSEGLNGTYTAFDARTGAVLGSISATQNLVVNNATIIRLAKQQDDNSAVDVYPNPASSLINVRTAVTGTVHVALVDMFGSTVKTVTFNGNTMAINTDELAAGTYTMTVNVNGTVTTKRIIVNR
jgi:hypothetical protein